MEEGGRKLRFILYRNNNPKFKIEFYKIKIIDNLIIFDNFKCKNETLL